MPKQKPRAARGVFVLFLFLVDRVGLSDRIEFLERKLPVCKLALVLGGVVDMPLANALGVAF